MASAPTVRWIPLLWQLGLLEVLASNRTATTETSNSSNVTHVAVHTDSLPGSGFMTSAASLGVIETPAHTFKRSTDDIPASLLWSRQDRYRCVMVLMAIGVVLLAVGTVYTKSGELSLGPCNCGCFRMNVCSARDSLGSVELEGTTCNWLVGIPYMKGSTDAEAEDPDETLPSQIQMDQLRLAYREDCETHGKLLRLRRSLLAFLFVAYAVFSAAIPVINRSEATCDNGFFWEDHLPFMAIASVVKVAECVFYMFDPTIHGELSFQGFMLKFLPSCLGFIDGYTDAVACVIASTCHDEAAQTTSKFMYGAYILGVVGVQWIVLGYLSLRDASHGCLMKLLHMDALAACVTPVDEESKNVWKMINVCRTIFEDIPQAALQGLFLYYDPNANNYAIIASVVLAVLCSIKAAVENCLHKRVAAGVQKFLQQRGEQARASLERQHAAYWGNEVPGKDLLQRQNVKNLRGLDSAPK